MTRIAAQDLPPDALLERYRDAGAYTDCFVATVPGHVGQARYIETFYTTPLFKLERMVLALLVGRPSTDLEARRLAAGETASFAAWTVEERRPDQILLCDFQGQTRSWLMSAPSPAGAPPSTTLFFGSAVTPRQGDRLGRSVFRALTGVHRLYSRALLAAAAARLPPETPAA